MIPVELLADGLATMIPLVELMTLIAALPAATQATASSLPNNQHHCNDREETHVNIRRLCGVTDSLIINQARAARSSRSI